MQIFSQSLTFFKTIQVHKDSQVVLLSNVASTTPNGTLKRRLSFAVASLSYRYQFRYQLQCPPTHSRTYRENDSVSGFDTTISLLSASIMQQTSSNEMLVKKTLEYFAASHDFMNRLPKCWISYLLVRSLICFGGNVCFIFLTLSKHSHNAFRHRANNSQQKWNIFKRKLNEVIASSPQPVWFNLTCFYDVIAQMNFESLHNSKSFQREREKRNDRKRPKLAK